MVDTEMLEISKIYHGLLSDLNCLHQLAGKNSINSVVSRRRPKLAANHDFCNLNFKLSLRLMSKSIYLRGINDSEIVSASYQSLNGVVTIIVSQPFMMGDLRISFSGHKQETVYHNHPHRRILNDRCVYEVFGEKMKDHRCVLDEAIIWKHKNYLLQVGVYEFPFNFTVDPRMPETISSTYINVSYMLNVLLQYKSKRNYISEALSSQQIKLIRCLADQSTVFSNPVVGRGNWRGLFLYEFSIQNKTAFQGMPFMISILITPSHAQLHEFEIYQISASLIQKLQFGIAHEQPTPTSFTDRRHNETRKFLLYNREQSLKDWLYEDNRYIMKFYVEFPSSSSASSRKKGIHPYTYDGTHTGFLCNHVLKVTFQVSEKSKKTVLGSAQSTARTTFPSQKSDSITTRKPLPKVNQNELKKFQKVELSLRSPLILLHPQSAEGSTSPPLYSNHDELTSENARHLQLSDINKKNTPGYILPPEYEFPHEIC